MRTRSDIALLKLTTPVADFRTLAMYQGKQEEGNVITVYGKGATGNGQTGEQPESKTLEILNQFHNVVEQAKGNWLTFTFDPPADALPLEGMHGSGDSGGASVIHIDGKPYLAGLSSWQVWHGDLADFQGGIYSTTAYQVRVSSYTKWIKEITGL